MEDMSSPRKCLPFTLACLGRGFRAKDLSGRYLLSFWFIISKGAHDANRNEGGVCVYHQTSLPFFVNAWKESGLLVDGIRDDAEGCNMLSYLRMENPKRGDITCDGESSGF